MSVKVLCGLALVRDVPRIKMIKFITYIWLLIILLCLFPEPRKALSSFTIEFTGGFAIIVVTLILAGFYSIIERLYE